MMDPHRYDELGRKARDLTISIDELDEMNAETDRRTYVLTAYADKALALKPLGPCGACGYGEIAVNPMPAQMSVMLFCGRCNQPRKLYANVGEPE
jgi:hypothetical protein